MSSAVAYKTIKEHIEPTPEQFWRFGRMVKRINAGLFEELAGDPNESIRISKELHDGHKIRKDTVTGQMKIIRTRQVPKNTEDFTKEYKLTQNIQRGIFKTGLDVEVILKEFEASDQDMQKVSIAKRSKILEDRNTK